MKYSEMLTKTKTKCSISGDTHDDFLKDELNFGQQDLCAEANFKFLETKGSFSAVQYQYIYDLASDIDVPRYFVYKQRHRMTPLNHDQWIRVSQFSSYGYPRFYYMEGDQVKFYPQPNEAAATTTLGAAITSSTAKTITLTSVADLKPKGRMIVGTEVIEWAYVDSDDSQIQACTRGIEGTTAATHSNLAAVTYRDIEYPYFKKPTDMSGDNDTGDIPANYHRGLIFYACSSFFDKAEQLKEATRYFNKYLIVRNQALKDLGEKQSQRFTSTLDDTEPVGVFRDNTFPDRSSLSAP